MKKGFVILFVSVCLLLVSCSNNYSEESFFCMDTFILIKADTADKSTLADCRKLLEGLDKQFSRHGSEGFVSEYNLSESGIEMTEDAKALIGLSESITDKTDGAFTVFSGKLTKLWENSTKYPSSDEINNAVKSAKTRAVFDGSKLERPNGNVFLEFGAIAKGYACDRAVAFLKDKNVKSGMVSFSSSIGVFGINPNGDSWKIAVKDPTNTDSIMGSVTLSEGFLSVSGDYERYFEIDGKKYNHIIDTETGVPVDNGIHSVVVVAPTGAESDALSTAIFVLGVVKTEEKFADSKDIKYLIVSDDGVFMNGAMSEIYTAE